jgi:hypothetical protein
MGSSTDIRYNQTDSCGANPQAPGQFHYLDGHNRSIALRPVTITMGIILTRSNEAQCEAYQKCFLEYYYCTTVRGNSLIFQREVLVLIYM